jgi:serine/threonine protein kinase
MQAGFPTGTEPTAEGKRFSFCPPTIDELKPHFPQLEVLAFIGQGGMGAVYKARQPMLDRYVALKILPPEASLSPGFTERFTREARALARLNHPNIVAVYEFGRSRRGDDAEGANGYHYLLMEFVDGANLRDMQRAQKLSPAEALSIVPKICEALQYAHDEGVVHRDIKPENILVDKKGRVKIADFGIAKILGTEQTNAPVTGIIGTPHYMAPEQVEKPQTVDHRADIYSVGVVFYEMLTGELPLGRFAAPSKKVQIDVRLDEVVLRALEKEPELRYQQAGQVKTAVETISTSPSSEPSTQVVNAFNAEKTAVATAQTWLELADARKYGETWDTAAGALQAATTRTQWADRMERYRRALHNVVSRHLAHTKTKPMTPGFSAGSHATVHFNTRFTEMNSATETVTLTLTSAGQWKVTGYTIKPTFSPSFMFDPKIRKMLWFVATVLFLSFLWINTFGSQPSVSWVTTERPDGSVQRTVRFFPQSTSVYSGLTAVAFVILLLATRNKRVSQQGLPGSGTPAGTSALRIPLVTVRNGEPKTNWPAVFVAGVLIAVLMAGAMFAGASFTLSDKPVDWVLKTMVLPVVVLIPLWLFLLIREEHQALRPRETSPISQRKLSALRRIVGSVVIAVIIAACVRIVIEPFRAMNDAVAPEINRGSTVFVYKLGHNYRPGDIVIYRFHATGYATKYLLGRVTELPHDGQVTIERRDKPALNIALSEVVGKVIFNTRSPSAPNSADRPISNVVETNAVSLSPVFERTVTDGIDLDTGKLIDLSTTATSGFGAIAENIRRAELVGVDAWMENSVLLGLGMTIIKAPDGLWHSATAQEIKDTLPGAQPVPLVRMEMSYGRPNTYFFKTREGATGILQVVAKTEAPAGVKIRYKLVQSSSGTSTQPNDLVLSGMPAVAVETIPPSGSTGVQPGVTEITVRFSKDMANDSYSWTSAWDNSIPEELGDPQFIDARTCRMKVKLEAGHTYAYWLNSQKFGNFRDASGNSSVPYLLIFSTTPK